jgi:hypothetical protein
LLAARDFLFLLANSFLELPRRNVKLAHGLFVYEAAAPRSDGTDGVLGLAGRTKFANYEDIQWATQAPGDFESNRHPAPGQGKYKHVALRNE